MYGGLVRLILVLFALQALIKAAVTESTISLMTTTMTQTVQSICYVSVPDLYISSGIGKTMLLLKGKTGNLLTFSILSFDCESRQITHLST